LEPHCSSITKFITQNAINPSIGGGLGAMPMITDSAKEATHQRQQTIIERSLGHCHKP